MAGIYEIRCLADGKAYVGSASNLRTRMNYHREHLCAGAHHNIHLQRAWQKHGERTFRFTVLEECGRDELLAREQSYIDSGRFAFNIAKTSSAPMSGRRHTDEARRRMSSSQSGHAFRGFRTLSDETKTRMADAHRGHRHTAESRVKMSLAQKGNKKSVGAKHNVGRKHSEESRRHMGEGKLGLKHSAEWSARIWEARRRGLERDRIAAGEQCLFA